MRLTLTCAHFPPLLLTLLAMLAVLPVNEHRQDNARRAGGDDQQQTERQWQEVLQQLVEEAQDAKSANRLAHDSPNIAERLNSTTAEALQGSEVIATALLTPQHRDPFIDSYIRWQITSFEPELPDLAPKQLLKIIEDAPALIENPWADRQLMTLLERAASQPRLSQQDCRALNEQIEYIDAQAEAAEHFITPALEWYQWMQEHLGETRVQPRLWLLGRLHATIEAGWATRKIKTEITKNFTASIVDRQFTRQQRQELAALLREMAGMKRQFVRQVNIQRDCAVIVQYSTAQVTSRDVNRWTAMLFGEDPDDD